jgi:3-hydroxyisobutyrate dehydrogenase-like beta-hydroxyacid dehydrogenase
MTSHERSAIAIIGLGRMGAPIAGRLAAAGHAVVGYDASAARLRAAAERGLRVAGSLSEAVRGATAVVTVLPGAPSFEAVMLGSGGVLEALGTGCCWLDLTSNDPRVAQRVAERSAARGVLAVGAPMGGGVDAAQSGALEFFVGGASEARERVLPMLSALADPGGIRIAGDDIASGYAAKLLINLLWFGQVAAVTETFLLGERLGVPADRMRSLLTGSAGDSAFAQRHLDRLLDGDNLETFGLKECVDELDILSELAVAGDVPFELSSAVARLHREALAEFGNVDGELMVARLLEQRAGTRLRREAAR